MTTRHDIALQAEAYLKTPFKHQGRLKSGVDCIGLAVAVARDLRLLSDETGFSGKRMLISDFDDPTYSREPTEAAIVKPLERFLDRLDDVTDIDVGDILLFRIAKRPQHIGIVHHIENSRVFFVHAYQPSGKVRMDDMGNRWNNRLIAAYRFRDSAFDRQEGA